MLALASTMRNVLVFLRFLRSRVDITLVSSRRRPSSISPISDQPRYTVVVYQPALLERCRETRANNPELTQSADHETVTRRSRLLYALAARALQDRG
ncbi:MAG TPA: hypothetical protein VII45_12910 [Solirubrobacterales bacterium]